MPLEPTDPIVRIAQRFLEIHSPARPFEMQIRPIAGDGSARRLYRVGSGNGRWILVRNQHDPDAGHPDENERFLTVREILHGLGVRVPDLLFATLDDGAYLLEDLGDRRLYDVAHEDGWDWSDARAGILDLYRSVLSLLVRMQKPTALGLPLGSVGNPVYDEAFILAAEARYFCEEFLCGHLGIDCDFASIEADCARLAHTALGEREARVLMHRDFQSRNLMVLSCEVVVIDFQGARLGPPEYDLASLLYDPYVEIPDPVRHLLLEDYIRLANQEGIPGIPSVLTSDWMRRLAANGANRMMQALGAFAKLGGRFGLQGFLESAPAGLWNLQRFLSEFGGCEALLSVVRQASDTCEGTE